MLHKTDGPDIIPAMAKQRIRAEDLDGLLMTPQEVAVALGLGTARVRQLAVSNALPSVKTQGGVRIYLRPDVEDVKKKREAK